MAIIATNTAKLPITEKLLKGQEIIAKGTNNPNVPGNAGSLATFSNAQADLDAANVAYESTRNSVLQLQAAREDALNAWNIALNGLAGVTENGTGGVAAKILTTGFDVRKSRTPRPPLEAPVNLQVKTNGSPGVTKLSWDPLDGAATYLVQQTPAPVENPVWTQVASATKSSCETNGVTPGTQVWYRVAGVDAQGQGPWSAAACRPVM